MDQQFNKPLNITNMAERSLVIYSHMFRKAQSNPEHKVCTPQLFVPDLIQIQLLMFEKFLSILKKYLGLILKRVGINGLPSPVMEYCIIMY